MSPRVLLRQIPRQSLWLGLSLLLIGSSCSNPALSPEGTDGDGVADGSIPAESTTAAVPILTDELAAFAQDLPITAQAEIGSGLIQLEVAMTRQQQSLGLMFRGELAEDRGMLFPFDNPRPVQFWMKNVFINLDMIFLRNGVVQAIAADVPPCVADPCPTYGPQDVVVDQVIELRGGRAAELGVAVDDVITIESVD